MSDTKSDPFDLADLYDCDESAEELGCSDVNDAIEEYLSNVLDLFEVPAARVMEQLEAMGDVTVYAWRRKEISERERAWLADQVLELGLECLDNNYDYSSMEASKPTEAMKIAGRAFADALVREYKVRSCEQFAERTFDVVEWAKTYRPDWLEDEAKS